MKELDRMKSDFVAGISHDLLSPLTYIDNYAAMLPIVDDPALEKEYVEKIMVGIDRMTRLVNDLLESARIEAGLHLQFDRVHVDKLLQEDRDGDASPAKVAGVNLVVEVADDLPTAVADPAQLRRAVTNLVTNGLKHAANSGPLTIHAEALGREMVISLAIAAQALPRSTRRIFSKNSIAGRSVHSRTGQRIGIGIGHRQVGGRSSQWPRVVRESLRRGQHLLSGYPSQARVTRLL